VSDDWNIAFFREVITPRRRDPITEQTLRNAGVGEEYWKGALLGAIPEGCPYKANLVSLIKRLHEDESNGKGAIFFGNFGFGKTAAAIIMLKGAIARGAQGFFFPAVDLEKTHDKPWAYQTPEGVHIWDMACRVHFFVLDDLGAELVSSGYKAGNTQIVESLIRSRHNKRLPTFITTNLSIPQLVTSYPSLRSILLDPKRFSVVEVSGKDWRYRD